MIQENEIMEPNTPNEKKENPMYCIRPGSGGARKKKLGIRVRKWKDKIRISAIRQI